MTKTEKPLTFLLFFQNWKTPNNTPPKTKRYIRHPSNGKKIKPASTLFNDVNFPKHAPNPIISFLPYKCGRNYFQNWRMVLFIGVVTISNIHWLNTSFVCEFILQLYILRYFFYSIERFVCITMSHILWGCSYTFQSSLFFCSANLYVGVISF